MFNICREETFVIFVVTNLVETVLSNNVVVEANGDDAGIVRIPRLGVATCGLLYFFVNRSTTLSVAVVVPFALLFVYIMGLIDIL